MMRPTILIVALMVVTAVDHASTMSSVQSVNATLEILVSVTVGLNGKRLIIVNMWCTPPKLNKFCKPQIFILEVCHIFNSI